MQNNAAAVIGKDLCSYKTLSWNGAWYYKIVYAAVPNLNGATYKWGTQSPSICFNKNRASSPNSAALGGDTQIDALIPFLDHEIIGRGF